MNSSPPPPPLDDDFNPYHHVINVSAGEDISSKLTAFRRQYELQKVRVLSASGMISHATMSRVMFSGGRLLDGPRDIEGLYEILSFWGTFGPFNRNPMSDSLDVITVVLRQPGPGSPLLCGGLGGRLIAATPVQVMVLSYVPEDSSVEDSDDNDDNDDDDDAGDDDSGDDDDEEDSSSSSDSSTMSEVID